MVNDIPKLDCKGCQSRDEIIKSLAEKLDELEKEKQTGKQETPVEMAA